MEFASAIPEGQITATIYTLIKENKYLDAIGLLQDFQQGFPNARAALSLLAYCQYQVGEFAKAAENYADLIKQFPEVMCYQLYHAQALFKACEFEEAWGATLKVTGDELPFEVLKLQAAIKFNDEELNEARSLVDQCRADDEDTMVNQACIMYAEGRYDEACGKFQSAMQTTRYRSDLAYNIALCHYRMKRFAQALKYIADIIERGIREHPELNVGHVTEGIDVRSVGNTQLLAQTALIEAFNLKAAIEYQLKNYSAAQEALTDMPPRQEEELDPVSLHNHALMNMDKDANAGFDKLQFLLLQNPCPPETFGNLLLLYCKYEHYNLAADVLAENAHLTYKLLSQYLYDFLDATIIRQDSAADGFVKFDEMATQHIDALNKLQQMLQSSKDGPNDDEQMKETLTEYDEKLTHYIPVLMAQAKIYWDLENYTQVEKIFRNSVQYCNEHDVWKLNVAHVLFMQAVVAQPNEQESKYREAIGFYEPIVKKNYEAILDISAIVLANLCVSYIMTSKNEQAEDLMRKIEKEEENLAYQDPDRKVFHLCIVNLVIGTLYCAKNNFQFGVSRIIKSLEPYDKKLGAQTWFYAKRCLCALIENMAKQLIMVEDSAVQEMIDFFEACEIHGRNVSTAQDVLAQTDAFDTGRQTVTYEARHLKNLLLKLM